MADTRRLVRLTGAVNNEGIQKVMDKVLELHEKNSIAPIQLLLHSAGGNLGIAQMFYTFIRATRIPLHTCAVSYIDSAATIVFLAGAKRYISTHTTMRIHDAIWAFEDKTKEPNREIEAGLQETRVRQNHWAKIFEEQTGGKVSQEDFNRMRSATTVLETADLLRLGVAHEIWTY